MMKAVRDLNFVISSPESGDISSDPSAFREKSLKKYVRYNKAEGDGEMQEDYKQENMEAYGFVGHGTA